MSGNEVTTITYAIYLLQLLLLPSQLISYLIRRADRTRLRYLLLLLSFIAFNSLWILTGNMGSSNNVLSVSLLQLSGIGLLVFSYFYIEKELGIFQSRRRLYLLGFVSVIFVFITWIFENYVDPQPFVQNGIFVIISLLGLMYFTSRSIRELIRSNISKRNPILIAGLVTLSQISIAPIVLFYIEETYLKNVYINSIFLFISFAYLRQYISHLLFEHDQNKSNNHLNELNLSERFMDHVDLYMNYGLSPRECEIAEMLLSGLSYQEISAKLNRTHDAMRKHGSNIFKKVGVSSLEEFRDKFS